MGGTDRESVNSNMKLRDEFAKRIRTDYPVERCPGIKDIAAAEVEIAAKTVAWSTMKTMFSQIEDKEATKNKAKQHAANLDIAKQQVSAELMRRTGTGCPEEK
jgi:hypothetical protein